VAGSVEAVPSWKMSRVEDPSALPSHPDGCVLQWRVITQAFGFEARSGSHRRGRAEWLVEGRSRGRARPLSPPVSRRSWQRGETSSGVTEASCDVVLARVPRVTLQSGVEIFQLRYAQAQGERGEEYGGTTAAAEVPRIQLYR